MPVCREGKAAGDSGWDCDSSGEEVSGSRKPSSKRWGKEGVPTTLPPLVHGKCLSCSLPCSTKSCKKWKSPTRQPRPVPSSSLARQQSALLSHFEPEQNISLKRSKSCGKGRSSAPSLEITDDVESERPSIRQSNVGNGGGSFKDRRGAERSQCGCLFLPGIYHKKKPVMQQVDRTQVPLKANQDGQESMDKESLSIASRAASLERFEYESWSSSAVLDGDDDGVQSYFDLPLELIRSTKNGTNSPVKAAFVFENDRKGSLKKSMSKLKSQELSNRHVRFSTSPTSHPASPSSACISPRMQKAREEFHAFLEARSA